MDKILESINNCEFCENHPCLIGCPLDNDIPGFIKAIDDDDLKKAYDILSETTFLMSICGRICPHAKQCEGSCIKRHTNNKVKIGKLESFVGDIALKNNWSWKIKKNIGKKVAVIGGGPAGLMCASFLKKNGVDVTIYEKYDYLGGLLVHGIPDFRLDKELVKKVIDNIINLGIDVQYNYQLGKNIFLKDLINEYDAVFIGIGANVSNKLHIKGENLKGVYGGNELLEQKKNIDFKDKTVLVIGGGDVAIDVARTIKRLNPKEVKIIYRGSKKNMKAEPKELGMTKKENIEIIYNTNIIKINGKEKVSSIEVVDTTTRIDESHKRIVENIPNTNHLLKCDYVITAIGSHAKPLIKKLDLELNNKGKLLIDKNGCTSNEKVFSGGDVAGIKSTVAWASRSGRNAAYAILEYLKK